MKYETIKPYIEKGLISEQAHPEDANVRIFNYTQACQFEQAWDDVTRQCRGLIMRISTGEILARPFPKFFNYGEHVSKGWAIPTTEPEIYEKLDGSLGILYALNGKPWIATRGSFTSEQALWATEWWRDHIAMLPERNQTHLFEIVAMWNRIVVKYDYEGLVHLTTLDTEKGTTIPYFWGGSVREVRKFEGLHIQDLERFLQAGSSQNDTSKRKNTLQREVENVSRLSTSVTEKGLSEKSLDATEISANMESQEQSSGKRIQEETLSQDSGSDSSGKEGEEMRGLQEEIPAIRDGLRPRSGEKEIQHRAGEKSSATHDRDKEMRASVFELPPHKDIQTENEEGFVIFYPQENVRMKIKFPEYVRLHKLITGVSEIAIWEHLRDNKTLNDLIEKVPDEFYQWVAQVSNRLNGEYHKIYEQAERDFNEILNGEDIDHTRMRASRRKDFAIKAQQKQNPGLLFAILDDKPVAPIIWRMVRPHGRSAFKVDIDA